MNKFKCRFDLNDYKHVIEQLRIIEDGLLNLLKVSGVGSICFSPLAQGILTDKYLSGLPKDSRAIKESPFNYRPSFRNIT